MYKIKRTIGRSVDYLMDWDSEWIAAFSSQGVALQFKTQRKADDAANFLRVHLPAASDGDVFIYEVI